MSVYLIKPIKNVLRMREDTLKMLDLITLVRTNQINSKICAKPDQKGIGEWRMLRLHLKIHPPHPENASC